MRKIFLFAAMQFFVLQLFGQINQLSKNSADSTIVLDDLVVTSTRASGKSPLAYSKVTKEDIAGINLGRDLPFLLSNTPSFVATSDAGAGVGYTGFRIRGTDAGRINITINGIPMNDAEEQQVFWVNTPDLSSSLENIQIQRGVGTSTNGAGAFGASINMQTEKLNSKPYAEISSSYGSFNTNKNTLKAGTGLLYDKFAFDARLSGIYSDGYIDRASTDMKSYYFSGAYYLPKTMIKAIIFGGVEKTYHAWNGVPGDSLATNRTYNSCGSYWENGIEKYYDNQTDNYDQRNYQLHITHTFNSNWNMNAALHYTRGIGYYEEYKDDEKLKKYGLPPFYVSTDGFTITELKKTDLIRQKWMDNDFYGGVFSFNYTAKKISATLGGAANQYLGDHYGYITWFQNAVNVDNNYEWYKNDSKKTDANVYAKINAELYQGLTVFADMQYRFVDLKMHGIKDKYDDNGMPIVIDEHPIFKFFNPKGGLHYELNKNNLFYASVAVANREPTRNNYTDAAENEQPVSERLTDYEVGYQFKNKYLSLSANYYFMDYKDQLILTGKVNEIGEPLTSNIPDSYRTGVELIAGVKITNWLTWSGNLTLSSNKIKNFTEYDVDEYDAAGDWIGTRVNYLGTTDIAYSPDITAGSLFSFSYKSFSAGLQTNYVGGQYVDNTSNDNRRLDAYTVSNLYLGYSLKIKGLKSIDFNLSLNNLFDYKYSSNGYVWYSWYEEGQRMNDLRYFPQAGFNVLGGVTLRF